MVAPQPLDARDALRGYLADGRTRLAVGAYDALTAMIAERAGFEIVHLTGYGASAALGGVPDIGLLTMSEMVDACRRICDSVTCPVIADADTGYGSVLSVRRTVREFESAGAAGLHIEDQVAPKRCGHMAGKHVIPTDEMVAKIEAALEARRDDRFVIIARTDARDPEGLDSALSRARAYKAAGVDVLFVEAPRDAAEIERIVRECEGPLLFNWSFDGVTPHVSRRWLEELGFSLVLFPDVAFAVHHALTRFEQRLAQIDSLDEVADQLTRFAEFNEFVGLNTWRQLEERYLRAGGSEP